MVVQGATIVAILEGAAERPLCDALDGAEAAITPEFILGAWVGRVVEHRGMTNERAGAGCLLFVLVGIVVSSLVGVGILGLVRLSSFAVGVGRFVLVLVGIVVTTTTLAGRLSLAQRYRAKEVGQESAFQFLRAYAHRSSSNR
jgi:hypothetical protein